MARGLVNAAIWGAGLTLGALGVIWLAKQVQGGTLIRVANALQGNVIPPVDLPTRYGYSSPMGGDGGHIMYGVTVHDLQTEHMANTLPPINPQMLQETPEWVERRAMSSRWNL